MSPLSSSVLWKRLIHVILKKGWNVARLQECSVSIDVTIVPRDKVIHLVETLVLHQWLVAVLFIHVLVTGRTWQDLRLRGDNYTSGSASQLGSKALGHGWSTAGPTLAMSCWSEGSSTVPYACTYGWMMVSLWHTAPPPGDPQQHKTHWSWEWWSHEMPRLWAATSDKSPWLSSLSPTMFISSFYITMLPSLSGWWWWRSLLETVIVHAAHFAMTDIPSTPHDLHFSSLGMWVV